MQIPHCKPAAIYRSVDGVSHVLDFHTEFRACRNFLDPQNAHFGAEVLQIFIADSKLKCYRNEIRSESG